MLKELLFLLDTVFHKILCQIPFQVNKMFVQIIFVWIEFFWKNPVVYGFIFHNIIVIFFPENL